MLVYIKSSMWDFLLCVVVSSALSFTLFSGFYATQPFQSFPQVLLIVAACAVVTLALFAVSLNTKTALIGGPILAVILGIIIAASYMASIDAVAAAANAAAAEAQDVAAAAGTDASAAVPTALDDVEGNLLYFALLTVFPAVAVYVLSRWRVSALLLLVLGVLVCGLVEYLYWYGHYAAFGVFLVGTAALYAYRTYQRSLMKSETHHLAFGSVTASGATLALASVALGVGDFALVIAPLNPPNLVLKLFVQEYRGDEREVRGIATTAEVADEQLLSNIMGSQIVYSSDVNDEMYNQFDDQQTGHGESSVVEVRNSSLSLGSMDNEEGEQDALSMEWVSYVLLIVVLSLLLLFVLAIVAKKLLRRRQYHRMLDGDNGDAVESLYLFFIDRFGKFKMPLPGTMTLAEYAANNTSTFARFEQHSQTPSFAELTGVYNRDVFGGYEVSDEERGLFEAYYRCFYRNACRFVGRLKYCLLFFRV